MGSALALSKNRNRRNHLHPTCGDLFGVDSREKAIFWKKHFGCRDSSPTGIAACRYWIFSTLYILNVIHGKPKPPHWYPGKVIEKV